MNLPEALVSSVGWGLWAYWLLIALMMVGLYIVIARDNLIKKVMGLNIFQAAAILFYVTMAKVEGGTRRLRHVRGGRGGGLRHGARLRPPPESGRSS